jgi:hypothetical protein
MAEPSTAELAKMIQALTTTVNTSTASINSMQQQIQALQQHQTSTSLGFRSSGHGDPPGERPPRFQKMDFPKFDGKSDPLTFINKCESYFHQQHIMEEEKVWVASRNLEDGARMWFCQVQQDEGTPAWRRFTELLHLRFGSPPCSNLLHHVSTTLDSTPAATTTFRRLAEEMDHFIAMFNRYRAHKEKTQHELQAAVRLQAAARGFLARRRVQSLRGVQHLAVISPAITLPSSEERAAVRLQAAGRDFLVRRMVRKMRMLLSVSLQQIAACTFNQSGSPIHPAAPTKEEIWVCGLPVTQTTSTTQQQAPTALAPTLVLLDRASVLVDCYILKLAVELFPWDPGRCRHLPRHPALQLEDELLLKGGRDVMWGRQYSRRRRGQKKAGTAGQGTKGQG